MYGCYPVEGEERLGRAGYVVRPSFPLHFVLEMLTVHYLAPYTNLSLHLAWLTIARGYEIFRSECIWGYHFSGNNWRVLPSPSILVAARWCVPLTGALRRNIL